MPGSISQLLTHRFTTLSCFARDLVRFLVLVPGVAAHWTPENLFLRKQLALFQERKVKPHPANDSTRLLMVILGRVFSWRGALVNVKPDTFLRWRRKGFRLFWRWKSRPVGRPQIPKDLCRLIREMAAQNPTWGEERIASELQLKLIIRVSPRTGKYLRKDRPVRAPDPKHRWLSDVRNHAKVIAACDFFVVISAAFRTLYVFDVIEIESRKILPKTSLPIPQRNGRSSNSAGGHPYASLSMIAIASLGRKSIKVSRTWGCEFCGPQCEPPRPTQCASAWAGAFAGNAGTS